MYYYLKATVAAAAVVVVTPDDGNDNTFRVCVARCVYLSTKPQYVRN